MKVALIRPPLLQPLKGFSITGAIPPIGLAYVAASARRAGHDVHLVDAVGHAISRRIVVDSPIGRLLRVGLSTEHIAEAVPEDADVVGISHMFLHEWPLVRAICERVRRRLPGAMIVLGGENASAYHPWIFRECAAVDACVLGEADESFPALLAHPRQAPGMAFRDGTRTPPAPRIKDVDDLPPPAWDLVPLDAYFRAGNQYGVERGRSMPVLGTRGCPYQCTFCSSPQMWTTRYVTRDPARVVDEIAGYVERYDVRDVDFVDLTAIVKKRWIVEFCRLLLERRLDITWQLPSGTRSEALDDEVLPLLHASGCRNLTYAPESGSPATLERIKKRVDPERLLASARAAARHGMVARINVVIGFPGETPRELARSLFLLLRAAWTGVQDAAVMIFAPYPGSELFHQLLADGRLAIDEAYPYLALSRGGASQRTYNEHLSAAQLRVIQTAMLAAFYATAMLRRPTRVLDMLRNARAGREDTQLEQFIRTRLIGRAPTP